MKLNLLGLFFVTAVLANAANLIACCRCPVGLSLASSVITVSLLSVDDILLQAYPDLTVQLFQAEAREAEEKDQELFATLQTERPVLLAAPKKWLAISVSTVKGGISLRTWLPRRQFKLLPRCFLRVSVYGGTGWQLVVEDDPRIIRFLATRISERAVTDPVEAFQLEN